MKNKTNKIDLICKGVIVLAIPAMIASFCVGITERPETEVKNENIEIPVSWSFPKIYYSADMPAKAEASEYDLFDKYFGDEAKLMRAICRAENGTQEPTRVSKPNRDGSIDIGLCQINSKAHIDKVGGNLELLKDPETNVRVAKEIRDSWESFEAWTCYRNGTYKKYLQD